METDEQGKISLLHQMAFTSHRYGWNYAIQALKPLHNPGGVLFDGYLENSFVWKNYDEWPMSVPYRQPWVGFLHNPPNMPAWFNYQDAPQSIMAQPDWQQSMAYCRGLFCLSKYQADWVRAHTDKPVSILVHPTGTPNGQFDFNRFVANPEKKIVQLGWWLRKLNAIYQLPIGQRNRQGYEKIRLSNATSLAAEKRIEALAAKEREVEKILLNPTYWDNTREQSRLSNEDYDRLLTENIAFVALHDASANNTVIECIARATALLVNPLPAVVEYLGEGYPFYFRSLAEAAEKV
ncbi:MAG: hypothetical protein WA947_02945 [Phormidesmis sp.]